MKKSSHVTKKLSMEKAKQKARKLDHDRSLDFFTNGKGLLLSRCSCGAMIVLRKVKGGWIKFGTALKYEHHEML